MKKQSVLFVCIHNSARSQMAEELLRKLAGDRFEAESAGIEPGKLNPVVVDVLKKEEGIDISNKQTRSVQDLLRQKRTYNYVITVCDETSAERCPTFPGGAVRLHWGFTDPSRFEGSYDEKYRRTLAVKDEIMHRLRQWLGQDQASAQG